MSLPVPVATIGLLYILQQAALTTDDRFSSNSKRVANRDALRISVFMNLFDTQGNRASVDGVIQQIQYFPGHLVSTDLDTASRHNERNAVVIDSHGQIVTLVQSAGLFARRILCHVKAGDRLTRGQRYGLIRFGSRVDVYLPPHAVPKVAPGEKVCATTTILATLVAA